MKNGGHIIYILSYFQLTCYFVPYQIRLQLHLYDRLHAG